MRMSFKHRDEKIANPTPIGLPPMGRFNDYFKAVVTPGITRFSNQSFINATHSTGPSIFLYAGSPMSVVDPKEFLNVNVTDAFCSV
jgi:hypothetical protein